MCAYLHGPDLSMCNERGCSQDLKTEAQLNGTMGGGRKTQKLPFEGVGGIKGRKIPFPLHRTKKALLSGPQVSWMYSAYEYPGKYKTALFQQNDSLNCYPCLTRASVMPLCWKEEGAGDDRNGTPTLN